MSEGRRRETQDAGRKIPSLCLHRQPCPWGNHSNVHDVGRRERVKHRTFLKKNTNIFRTKLEPKTGIELMRRTGGGNAERPV